MGRVPPPLYLSALVYNCHKQRRQSSGLHCGGACRDTGRNPQRCECLVRKVSARLRGRQPLKTWSSAAAAAASAAASAASAAAAARPEKAKSNSHCCVAVGVTSPVVTLFALTHIDTEFIRARHLPDLPPVSQDPFQAEC